MLRQKVLLILFLLLGAFNSFNLRAQVVNGTLRDSLTGDQNSNGLTNPGDSIAYKAKLKNTNALDAQGVQYNNPTPANTTLGTNVRTSALARNDAYSTSFSTLLNGTTVLANDFGVPMPSGVLTFGPTANPSATNAGSPGTTNGGGTLTVNANGTFSYTPAAGFSGTDQFKYITGNGNLPNNDAIVTITVAPDILFGTRPVNPLCNGQTNGSIVFSASGGTGALQYSITGAAGTYQASNSFTGLAAGTYNPAVKDAVGYIKTGSPITLTNPAAIVISGTTPLTLSYNVAMSTVTYTKTGGTGTPANPWSATGFPTGVSINTATGAVTGTPSQTGNFSVIITYTDANGCTGTKNVTVTVAPNLAANSYTVVGNTQLVADAHSTPATAFTSDATNILTNDQSDAAITITAVTNAATTSGGTITINAAGKFIYSPPAGFTGADNYVYTGTSNGISATATISFTVANMIWYVNNTYAGANGTANGTSHRPFTDLVSAATASAINQFIYIHTGSGNTTGNAVLKSGQTLRGAGSALSVAALSIGAGTKPTLSGTVTLANSVNVDGFDMSTATATAISSSGVTSVNVSVGNITTSGAVNAVTLSTTTGSVTIAGGTITGGAGAAFNITGGTVNLTYSGSASQATASQPLVSISGGHATGTITFQTGTLSASNGTGLQFDNADGIYNFNGTVTLNGGDAGIDIINGSGGNFSFLNTAITNPSGVAFNVNGGAGSIGHSGAISKSSGGRLIDIQSRTGGSVTVNGNLSSTGSSTGINVSSCTGGSITFAGGTKTINTGTSTAVTLLTNTGSTINFTGGGLDIDVTTATGFNATGGGTISIQGTGNSITSGSGIALNVTNTTIGGSGLTFQSISANGGANGIVLNSTGAGGLSVTGTGTTDGTGGTIQNNSTKGIFLTSASNISLKNMNLISANNSVDGGATGVCDDLILNGCNAAIYLSSVNTITLDNVDLTGTMVENGITGINVSTMTINNCTITGAGNELNESAMEFQNLSGTCSVTNSNFSFSETNTMDIVNNDVNLTLNISGSTFRDTQTQSSGGPTNTNGEGGLQFRTFSPAAGTTTSNIKIENSNFLNLRTQAIQAFSSDDALLNIDIKTSTIDCGTDIGAGIDINANNNSILKFNILNNPLIKSRGGSTVNITSFINGHIEGRVNGNNISANGTGAGGTGVRVLPQENGARAIVEVRNNTITMGAGNGSSAIDCQARFNAARMDLTLDNNNLDSDPASVSDINITAGSSASGAQGPETNQVFLNMINNDVLPGGPTNILRLRVSDLDASSDPRIFLQGFVEGGAGIEDDAVATWNANGNTPTATTANISVSLTGTATGPSAGTPVVPANPILP